MQLKIIKKSVIITKASIILRRFFVFKKVFTDKIIYIINIFNILLYIVNRKIQSKILVYTSLLKVLDKI